MGKSTISMAIFNSKLLVYQRVSKMIHRGGIPHILRHSVYPKHSKTKLVNNTALLVWPRYIHGSRESRCLDGSPSADAREFRMLKITGSLEPISQYLNPPYLGLTASHDTIWYVTVLVILIIITSYDSYPYAISPCSYPENHYIPSGYD